MKIYRFFLMLLTISILLALDTQARTSGDSNINMSIDELMISVISLEINDKALNLTYEIKNHSNDEIWIYTGEYYNESTFGMDAMAYVSENGHTLTLEARSHMPRSSETLYAIYNRFVRLRPGHSQTESIFMKIPVYPIPRLKSSIQKRLSLKYAKFLAIEIGYYSGNLPEQFLAKLEKAQKYRPLGPRWSILPHYFSLENEYLISRDDELLIEEGGYNILSDKNQQALRVVINDVNIPYKVMSGRKVDYELPDLLSCKKVEIQYKPSMLEYFFPFALQKNLLSPEELDYLQSENTLLLEDMKKVKFFADDVGKMKKKFPLYTTCIARYRNHVDLIAHYDDKPSKSFYIYNDNTIGINCNILQCPEGFPSLKMLTPRIRVIDLRMQCAANLKNQWYRFRFYNYHEAVNRNDLSIINKVIYPRLSHWCDDILYKDHVTSVHINEMWDNKPHICPSAAEGKNHYAMNPNCEPNSPGNMVLLFETKAGWNQHGGPELFTFDNHDPKGGCVLLNDGTVKFIRTKEELNTLKWK